MKPPYNITYNILSRTASISEKIGEVNAKFIDKQSPQLRRQNRIKTIHSSLQIEGNRLSEEQVTAVIDNKQVVGPQKVRSTKGLLIHTMGKIAIAFIYLIF